MKNTACIAMDIGGTNLRLALVSREGSISKKVSSPCNIASGLDSFLDRLAAAIDGLFAYAAEKNISVVAVGAGVPGLIRTNGEIISSVNLKPLNSFNLQQWLTDIYRLPAVIINDANAAAVAEHEYGAGRSCLSLLHFTLGTGVGSGLILNNSLWTGSDGVAAEYGHATVEPDGHLCSCGNHGCLEQYASATAIVKMASGLLASGRRSCLDLKQITAAEVAAAAAKGDSVALECFALAGRYLGIAAATAVNMLNLDAITFGGGVSASFHLMVPYIRREIDNRAFLAAAARVKLLQSELADDAGIKGAAAAAWKAL